jgi:4-amino-4-deoxy-L-arabinose transferase-like glycosyltransferase
LQLWIARILVLGAGLFLLFGHIEKLPLRQYDEARQAINAMEMLHSGNWLVTSYDHEPETWNTKPPLLIWLQASFMAVLGPTELAVRLPSAFAALMTGFLLWFFAKRHLNREYLGLLAAGILFTTAGYVRLHGTRTGDFDALLTLFTTWAGISLWLFVERQERKFLIHFFVALTLGVFTKGIAALLFAPAYLLFLLTQKQLAPTLRLRTTWIALAVFLIIIAGYYGLRNELQPGYLAAVAQNELGGRFAQTTEGHSAGFSYYFEILAADHFFPWIWLLPAGVLLAVTSRSSILARFWSYCLLLATIHLLVISSSGTKLEWYALPVYPWLALMTAGGLYFLGESIHQSWPFSKIVYQWMITAMAFLLFYPTFTQVRNATYRPHEAEWDKSNYAICYFLREVLEEKRDLPAHKLVHWGYDAHARYYAMRCTAAGFPLRIVKYDELQSGDTVLTCHREMEEYLEKRYSCSSDSTVNTIRTYIIHGSAANH